MLTMVLLPLAIYTLCTLCALWPLGHTRRRSS